MAKFDIRTYMKNATKSIAYIATDTLGELNPAIKDFASSNKDLAKSLYDNVRDIKKTTRLGMSKAANDEYTKIAGDFVKNTIEDFKTGKWYNKDREEKAAMEAFGFDDWDFGSDFDIEDNDTSISSDDMFMASTIDDVGSKIAKASANATIQSAQFIAESNHASNKVLIKSNEHLTGQVTMGLATVNSTISSLATAIVDPLSTHIKNSTQFYETTTQLLQDQNKMLADTTKLLKDRYEPKKKSTYKTNKDFSYASSGGVPDLTNYLDIIKGNIKDMTSMYTDMLQMADMGGKKGSGIRALTSSPISMMVSMAAQSIAKNVVGDAFERFNQTLQGLFGSLIMKINQNQNDFGTIGMLARIFGIKSTLKKDVDTSKYEKGRVDFDGITRKSIIEVIPTQLSKIVAALTGEPEQRFDYKTGKFVTVHSIKKNREQLTRRHSNSASSDMQTAFQDYINKLTFENRQQKDQFQEDIEKFFESLFKDAKMYDYKKFDQNDKEKAASLAKNYGDIDPNTLRIITEFYRANERNKKGYLNLGINSEIFNQRSALSRALESEERSGDSLYTHLYNNSFSESKPSSNGKSKHLGLLGVEDDKGNNIFFYLQNFYSDIKKIVRNTSDGFGGGGGKPSGGKGPRNKRRYEDKDFAIPDNRVKTKEEEEKEKQDKLKDEYFEHVNKRNRENNGVDFGNLNNMSSDDMQKLFKPKKTYMSMREKEKQKAQDYKDLYNKYKENGYSDEEASKTAAELTGYDPKDSNLARDFSAAGTIGDKIYAIKEHFMEKFNPSAAVSRIVDSIDTRLYNMIYGKDNDPEDHNSIMGRLFNNIDKGFNDFFAKMKDKAAKFFGETLGLNRLKEYLFGEEKGKLRWLSDPVKASFKSVKGWIKGAVSSTGKAIMEPFVNSNVGGFATVDQAYGGGVVKRTGLAAVSEGEIIIPSDYNPLYKGTNNKTVQKGRELKAKDNFYRGAGSNVPYFGEYNEGGFAGKAKEAFNSFRAQGMDIKDALNMAAETLGVDPEEIKDSLGSAAKIIKAFAIASGKTLFSGAVETKDRLFGKPKDDDKAFGEALSDVMGNLKKYAPDMITGGVIGAGVSLVGGLIGGPLLGAAAGAATSLVIKSNKVQKWLFGDVDAKTGDRQGGVFNAKLSNYLTKTFPDIAKFGVTGALASLIPGIPGGPIAGMLVGSALGTMWKNQKFQDWLFGNEEAGITGKIDTEKIKKIAPNIGAGAIAGIIGGPFGLVGNIMLGSALGYASTTDKFKHAVFGEPDANGEYHGGLLGYIKDDIIDPLKQYIKDNTKSAFDYIQEKFVNNLTDAIKPIGRQIELLFGAAGKALKTQFKTHVTIPIGRSIEKWIIKPAAGILGGIFKKTIKPVVDIASIPFRAVGRAGRALQKRQVEQGTATYMDAKERLKYREKTGMSKTTSQAKLDETLANMKPEEILNMQNQFNTSKRAFKKLGKEYDDASGEFSKKLEAVNIPMSQRKKIKKALNSGNYDEANKVISNLKIDDNNKKMLTDEVGSLSKKIGSADQLSKVLNEDQNKIFDTLKEKGIDVNSKNFGKILDLINVEAKSAKAKIKAVENLPTDEKIEYNVSNIYDEIVKVNTNLENIIKGKDKSDEVPGGKDDSKKKDDFLPPGQQKQDGEEDQDQGTEDEAPGPGKRRWKLPWPFKKKEKVDYNYAADDVQEQIKEVFESMSKAGWSDDQANQMAKDTIAPDGTVLRYRTDARSGKIELDKSDPATAQYIKDKNADKSFKTKLLEKVSGLGFLKGIFDKLTGKGNDDTEKKKGIFSKIGDFLGSAFSGLVGALGGLIPALTGAAGVLLTVLGWKHVSKGMDSLEDLALGRTEEDKEKYDFQPYMSENIERRGFGVNFLLKGQNPSKLFKGKGPVSFVARNTFKAAEYGRDKIKSGAGRVISNSKTFGNVKAGVSNTMTNMFSSETYRETLDSLVMSGMDKDQALSMAKEMTGGTKGGIIADKVSSLASKSKTVDKAVTAVNKVVGENGIVQLLKSKVSGLFERIANIGFIKNKIPGGFMEAIVEKFVPSWAKVLAEKGGKKIAGGLAKTIAKIGPIGIGVAAMDFVTGFQDARSILGIIDEPTAFQRLLSGLAKGLNGLVPVVGGIIPTEYIMDILINVLDAFTSFDMSGIKKQRAEAQEVVDAYNKENNTHMTVREYCKNVLGDYTITERLGKAAKSAGNWIADKAKDAKDLIMNATPVGDVVRGAGNIGKGFMAGVKGDKEFEPQTFTEKLGSSAGQTIKNLGSAILKGDVAGVMMAGDDDKSLASTVISGPLKPLALIPTAVIGGVKAIGKGVSSVIKYGKEAVGALADIGKSKEDLKNADLKSYFDIKSPISDSNPFKPIITGVNLGAKAIQLPIYVVGQVIKGLGKRLFGGIKAIGGAIFGGIKEIGGAISEDYSTFKSTSAIIKEKADKGAIVDLWTTSVEYNKLDPFAGIFNKLTGGIKLINMPTALIKGAINFFGSVGEKIEKKFPEPVEYIKRLWAYGTNGKSMFEYYKEKLDADPKTTTGKMSLLVCGMLRDVIAPIVLIRKAIHGIGSVFGNIGKGVKNTWNNVKEGASNIWGNVKESVGSFFGGIWDTVTGVGNKGLEAVNEFAAGGSFVSQKDPQYNNQKYGNGTIGDIGCGPATAAMVINQTTGRNVSLSDTANYAAKRGYVAGGASGTKSGYFEDIFSQYGLGTSYTDRQSDINKSLSSGKPTILLGQDRTNKSKSNSPFGPNPHYVVANGYDRSGNVIINDPELNGPVKYSKNILNKTKLGVSVGAGSRLQQLLGGASLLTLTHDIMSANEGNYDSVNANDNGSMSIGKIQWNANAGRAQPLLKNIIAKVYNPKGILGESLYHNIMGTNWTNAGRTASKDEVPKLKALLGTQESIDVQNELIKQELNKYIENAKRHGITDEKSQIYLADFENQYGGGKWYKSLIDQAIAKAGSPEKVTIDILNSIGAKMTGGKYASRRNTTYNKLKAINEPITDDGTIKIKGVDGKSNSTSTDTTEPESTNPFSGGISGFLGNFFKGLGKQMFGGTEKGNAFLGLLGLADTEETTDTSSTDQSTTDTAQMPITQNVTKAQKALLDKINSVANKNEYTQDTSLRTRVGDTLEGKKKGYGDCSSTVQWAYKNALGIDPGGNTGAQIVDSDGVDVDTSTGNGPNTKNLQPGDLLFYKRPTSNKPFKVGHVEMYVDENTRIGHGGGMGPKPSPITTDAGNYIKARRFIKDSSVDMNATGTGSGLSKPKSANVLNYVAAGSGLSTNQQILLERSSRQLRNKVGAGASNDEILILIKSIIQVLQNISNNTYKINNIISVLTNYFNSKTGGTTDTSTQQQVTNKLATSTAVEQAKDIQNSANVTQDQDIQQLMKMLTTIASS